MLGPVPHPGRLPTALLALMLTTGTATACSRDDGCAGQVYHPDLGAGGATSPIDALEVWIESVDDFDPPPPVDGWFVQEADDPQADRVEITNDDGDGWWVATVRTDDGGYVVSEATDEASGCDDLS